MAERAKVFCIKSENVSKIFEILGLQDSCYKLTGDRLTIITNSYPEYEHLYSMLADKVPCAFTWILVMAQEGSIWEYLAFADGKEVDQFSVCRAYWDEEDQPSFMGNPKTIAQLFSVSVANIINYYRTWLIDESGNFTPAGLAYPGDESGFGSVHQYIDFIRALGFDLPNEANGRIFGDGQ